MGQNPHNFFFFFFISFFDYKGGLTIPKPAKGEKMTIPFCPRPSHFFLKKKKKKKFLIVLLILIFLINFFFILCRELILKS